ncbi:hypothetical protein [Pseudomonas sp. NPDC089758]|uniref:hypothetical protein n=1 Tax=Pseudomonas sp. NPDC089758 TaxID=3364473 RepID=UPI003805E862
MVTEVDSNLVQIVGSELYQKMISELTSVTKIEIESEYAEIFARLDAAKLVRAGLSAQDVMVFMSEKYDAIKQYSIIKLSALPKDEDDEEYSPGLAPPDDERSKTIEVGKYSQGFLVTNTIEYALAIKGFEPLLEYLKKSRIPNAKKYAGQIIGFVDVK